MLGPHGWGVGGFLEAMLPGVLAPPVLQGEDRRRGGPWRSGWWPQQRPMGQTGSLDVLWPEVRSSLFFGKQTLGGRGVGPTDPPTHHVLRECLTQVGFSIGTGAWSGRATTGFSSSTPRCSCPCGRSPWTWSTAGTSTGSSRTRRTSASWGPRPVSAGPVRVQAECSQGAGGTCALPGCGGH